MSSHSVLRNVIQPKSISDQPSTAPPIVAVEPQTASALSHKDNDLETQLGILVENAPIALSMFDDQMRYIVANRIWIEEFGLQHVQPLIGRSQYEIFPGLHPGWRQVYDRALQGHVVRSEHDAISGHDGKPIVYRWEVRPWRKKLDASVGGLMVICEKFAAGLGPASTETEKIVPHAAGAADPASALLFQSSLPIVILDETGVVIMANDAAVGISLSRGIREGESFYWEAFSEGYDHASLKEQTLASISRLLQDSAPHHHTIVTQTITRSFGDNDEPASLPTRWMLSKIASSANKPRFMAIAMPGLSPFDVERQKKTTSEAASPPTTSASSESSLDADVLHELQDKLNATRQEVAVLREAEQAFAKREGRQRAVLEALACGLVVLDERGMPIYHNQHITSLLGHGIQRGESVEQWLMQACPTEAHKKKVAGVWAQDVWSRQLVRILSLVTADGLLKELEFRPVPLNGGGVLVSIQDVTDQCRIEDILQSTEAKLRVLVQDSPAGIVLVDKGGAIFEVNPVAEEMTGHSKAALRRLLLDEWLTPDSAAARKEALRLMRDEGRRSASLDVQILRANGSLLPANLRITLVNDADRQPHCTVHFLQSVGAVSSESHASTVRHDGHVGQPDVSRDAAIAIEEDGQPTITVRWLLQTDQSGRVATWSADAQEVFGFDAAEITGNWLHGLFRPSDPTGFYAALQERVLIPDEAVAWGFFGKGSRRGTARFFVKSAGEGGNAIDLFEEQVTPAAMKKGSQSSNSVLPRTHIIKPSQLWPVADLDREKLLLSETHHRIKNHLQIISSMLNLQLNSLVDLAARAALRSSQNRVRSIAALHQHLYQLALGEGPGFDEFAKGLSQRLRECYEVPEEQVAMRLEITARHLQQEWMMPLALILNETLSNAFEHAFPENRRGNVTVRLALEDGTGVFEVCDDGVGLPEGFDPTIAPGLGLKILGVFADQMRGELKLSGDPEKGTKFNLRFPMAHVDN